MILIALGIHLNVSAMDDFLSSNDMTQIKSKEEIEITQNGQQPSDSSIEIFGKIWSTNAQNIPEEPSQNTPIKLAPNPTPMVSLPPAGVPIYMLNPQTANITPMSNPIAPGILNPMPTGNPMCVFPMCINPLYTYNPTDYSRQRFEDRRKWRRDNYRRNSRRRDSSDDYEYSDGYIDRGSRRRYRTRDNLDERRIYDRRTYNRRNRDRDDGYCREDRYTYRNHRKERNRDDDRRDKKD